MSGVLAVSNGVLFSIGALVFIAVFTAALPLAYLRFAEIGEAQGGPPVDDEETSGREPGPAHPDGRPRKMVFAAT